MSDLIHKVAIFVLLVMIWLYVSGMGYGLKRDNRHFDRLCDTENGVGMWVKGPYAVRMTSTEFVDKCLGDENE